MLKLSIGSFSKSELMSSLVVPDAAADAAENVEFSFSFISIDCLLLLVSVDARSVITLQTCASSCVNSSLSVLSVDDGDAGGCVVLLFFSGSDILFKFAIALVLDGVEVAIDAVVVVVVVSLDRLLLDFELNIFCGLFCFRLVDDIW
jgi:hypothetical protein